MAAGRCKTWFYLFSLFVPRLSVKTISCEKKKLSVENCFSFLFQLQLWWCPRPLQRGAGRIHFLGFSRPHLHEQASLNQRESSGQGLCESWALGGPNVFLGCHYSGFRCRHLRGELEKYYLVPTLLGCMLSF